MLFGEQMLLLAAQNENSLSRLRPHLRCAAPPVLPSDNPSYRRSSDLRSALPYLRLLLKNENKTRKAKRPGQGSGWRKEKAKHLFQLERLNKVCTEKNRLSQGVVCIEVGQSTYSSGLTQFGGMTLKQSTKQHTFFRRVYGDVFQVRKREQGKGEAIAPGCVRFRFWFLAQKICLLKITGRAAGIHIRMSRMMRAATGKGAKEAAAAAAAAAEIGAKFYRCLKKNK